MISGSGTTCRCASVTRDTSGTRSPAATDQPPPPLLLRSSIPADPVLVASTPSALTGTRRPRAPVTPASRATPTSSASPSVPSTPTVPRDWPVSATSVWTLAPGCVGSEPPAGSRVTGPSAHVTPASLQTPSLHVILHPQHRHLQEIPAILILVDPMPMPGSVAAPASVAADLSTSVTRTPAAGQSAW